MGQKRTQVHAVQVGRELGAVVATNLNTKEQVGTVSIGTATSTARKTAELNNSVAYQVREARIRDQRVVRQVDRRVAHLAPLARRCTRTRRIIQDQSHDCPENGNRGRLTEFKGVGVFEVDRALLAAAHHDHGAANNDSCQTARHGQMSRSRRQPMIHTRVTVARRRNRARRFHLGPRVGICNPAAR